MRRHWLPLALASVLTATAAHASFPMGVWVKVQKVAFEPNTTTPTRIRIYGAAILFKGRPPNGDYMSGYTAPALGYLYYECPSADLATCFQEWQDVQANIGTPPEVCVGLGAESLPPGRLRPVSEAPSGADAYPLSMGVQQGYTPCQAIADFLRMHPDGGTGGDSG